MPLSPTIIPASDHSLLVLFGRSISPDHHRNVHALTRSLLAARPASVINIHPAYSSVLVSYDPRSTDPGDVENLLRKHLDSLDSITLPEARSLVLPVCYGGEYGPDLPAVAAQTSKTMKAVVEIHSASTYHVYFLGFSPGFPYMGGLDRTLAVPRHARPRARVPAGSVAIGGSQTGVYPLSSPGGWQIIGRTPVRLFDPDRTPPNLIDMGDQVSFRPVSEEEFRRWTP